MSYPTSAGKAVEGVPMREAQSCLTPKFANATYQFFLTGTSTAADVYQDGALTSAFPIKGNVQADNYGRFPPIYLNTATTYKVQLYDGGNVLRYTVDPYVPPLATVGTSSLSAFGMNIATTGEVTVPAPTTGGTGVSLTLNAGSAGITPLELVGTLPGNSALIINTSATTGAQTAIFQANNKPGPPPVSYNVTATAAPSGATYTGGNLTANFTGVTAGNYTLQLSTGQDIFGVTFTNGSTTFITPSTVISGTPTTALIVSVPVTPSWWLPITCDGVQYYTPIWHGSSQSQFLPSAPASPSAQGETIVGTSFTLSGAGVTTVTGGTATPGNWLVPTSAGAGANYWIKITKTGGMSGLAFSAANGSFANITSGGLTVSSNAAASISGTYQLSTSSGGTPVVASGTITLSGGTGVQQPTYNGAANLVLNSDGTATLNGVSTSNWYSPTTTSVGTGTYIKITQSGGTSGTTFNAATTYTQIGAGLTIGITGGTGSTNATGTYIIASDSGGVNQLGTGNITLSASNLVQSPNWSGTTPLVLAGNGAATLNGSATSSWYSPNASNVGSLYWINITRTSGTTGVNFSNAQGSWTNITNGGLTIDMTGYTGDVGTVTVGGTYQISSSSSGTPVLGSGSISLSVNAGTVTRTYTTGTAATETIPVGATTCVVEAWGAGGGGGSAYTSVANGSGGGAGGYSRTSFSVSGQSGKTFTYTVGAAGAGGVVIGNGVAGGATTIAAGTVTGFSTMTANGGGQGLRAPNPGAFAGGAGGTVSGGNVTNTTGGSGTSGTYGSPSNPGAAGGTGVTGLSGPHGAGGTGGSLDGGGNASNGVAGGGGTIVFKYS